MSHTTTEQRRHLESLPRADLERFQLERLNSLLDRVLPANQFYAQKLARVKRPVESLAELADWPCTFKEELLGHARDGDTVANLTWPLTKYSRFHQTSGTTGRPMVVLDTPDDWQWVLQCWEYVLDAAGITSDDRVLMAFSFGPHIGFWGAYEAMSARGALVIPSGGMSSLQRLELARNHSPTVLCCTPSYALHLAEVGGEHDIDVSQLVSGSSFWPASPAARSRPCGNESIRLSMPRFTIIAERPKSAPGATAIRRATVCTSSKASISLNSWRWAWERRPARAKRRSS